MRDSFKEYYRPTDDEFDSMWKNCEFVFDANVLLNVYRYSSKTSEELLHILKQLKDRLWLPHQAALEYQKNRYVVIEEQVTKSKKLESLLAKNDLLNFLNDNERHPFIDSKDVLDKLKPVLETLKKDITDRRDNYPNTIEKDDLRDTITELFDGKVGSECPNDKLEYICKIGEKRFLEQIPPGFEDSQKDGNNKYGDLILWCQLIHHAKLKKKPIVFVTDDVKKDWWLKRNNAIISPHPLLMREMRLYSGVDLYIYRTEHFMENAKKYFNFDVTEDSLKEIENVQRDIKSESIYEYEISVEDLDEAITEYYENMDELALQREHYFRAVPISETLSRMRPVSETLVRKIPVNETLTRMRPASEALVRKRPVSETLVRKIPVSETLTRMRPASEASVRKIPVSELPVEDDKLKSTLKASYAYNPLSKPNIAHKKHNINEEIEGSDDENRS